MPAPTTYSAIFESKKSSAPALYRTSRKTDITEIVSKAEKRTQLGPGSFNPAIVKRRVIGTYGGQERVTMAEAIILTEGAKLAPDKYSLPSFGVTKNVSRRTIIKAETAKE